MKDCLQEDVLQSYLDGELSSLQMQQVSSHLSSCAACHELARALEQENAILATALAPEFEVAVPSERLRQRVETAIAAMPVRAVAPVSKSRIWFASFSELFTFKPQRAFAYASLMVIVGFGLIMGLMRWQATPVSTTTPVAVTPSAENNSANNLTPPVISRASAEKPVAPATQNVTVATAVSNNRPKNYVKPQPAPRASEAVAANHVKLLPGERSYLQTIAQLDSTIKADQSKMKPEVQAEYQRNLAFVDRTLAVARTAAKSNPNDPDAAEFMFSAYQSKVDLLNTVAEARVK
jgi:anti-sigma factor RsiW